MDIPKKNLCFPHPNREVEHTMLIMVIKSVDPGPVNPNTDNEVFNGLFGDLYQQHFCERTKWDFFVAQVESVARFRESSKSDIKILDVASGGCGEPAITLSKNGYNVWATDGYEKMFHNAVKRAKEENAKIIFSDRIVKYHELRDYYTEETFNAVFCSGNAICHVPPGEVDKTLKAMAALIKSGGFFILDAKQFTEDGKELECDREKMQSRVRTVRDSPVNYRIEDKKIVRMRSFFTYPDELSAIYHFEFYFTDGKCERVSMLFWRYTAQYLKEKFENMGLRTIILSPDVCTWKFDILVGGKG